MVLMVALVMALLALPVRAETNIERLSVAAPSAYLIDVETGAVLYSKSAEQKRAVASTTKILTAWLVLDNTEPGDLVTVSDYAAGFKGSTIGLRAGEQRTVRELLHALMLISANDAAIALAEHVGGSETGFAGMMNDRAASLGATHSRFVVPHGFAGGDVHYSTAADMSKIAMEAMKNADFRAIVSRSRFTWDALAPGSLRELNNTNALLESFPLATGIKTGFINESGYCLVGSASANGRTVLVVVLGGATRTGSFDDGRALLDWGLNAFDYRKVVVKNRRYGAADVGGKTIPLVAAESITDLLLIGEETVKTNIELDQGADLPVRKGDELGELLVSRDGLEDRRVRLVAGRSVYSSYATRNVADYFWRVVNRMINLF